MQKTKLNGKRVREEREPSEKRKWAQKQKNIQRIKKGSFRKIVENYWNKN